MDDGKWRGYIEEPLPKNPTTEQAQRLMDRVKDLSYYGQNLPPEHRNAIYRYIISLSESCANSPAMDPNWQAAFKREEGATRRLITHD